MTIKTWRFTAFDTLFFKEARQMDTFGGSELNSVFPPSARTIMGAVRTAIGESFGVDWAEYKKNPNYKIDSFPFREHIGYGEDTGKLYMKGPWLSLQQNNGSYERLYPIPRHLFIDNDKIITFCIDKPIQSDLGDKVCLPTLNTTSSKPKQLSGWVTKTVFEKILRGEDISDDKIYTTNEIYTPEPRLGIARDNTKRVVEQSMLYQTKHVRMHSRYAIEVDLNDDTSNPVNIVRLGGEARLAGVTVTSAINSDLQPPTITSETFGMKIILLTPVLLDNNWFFDGFTQSEQDGCTVWKGSLCDVNLTIYSAVIGKAQREGGWDLANHRPRPVKSLIPAGSVYYCTVDDGDIDKAIQKLHLQQIANDIDKKLGRGQIAIGLWKKSETLFDTRS